MTSIRRVKVVKKVANDAVRLSNAFITGIDRQNDGYNNQNGAPKPGTSSDPGPEVPKEQLVAVKDNIATVDFPTTCASGILRNHQSPFEADVITQITNPDGLGRRVITGKTNMDEFGMGSHSTNSFFGPVRNTGQFDTHSVGGSSGGSAVAVANAQCPVALGTDTGGSVRLPAAYTGIVGFKPSYGLVSRWGVVPYANSLDTVGFLAAKMKAIHSAFTHVSKFDIKDPTSISQESRKRMDLHRKRDLRQDFQRKKRSGELDPTDKLAFNNKKIGVPLEYNIEELDPGVRQAWQDALKILQEGGATIVPISLPNTKHALSAYYVLAPAEAASNLSKYDGVRYGTRSKSGDGAGDVLYSKTRGTGFGNEAKRRILLGSYTLSSEAIDNYFIKAQKVRRLVQRDFDRVFAISNPLRKPEQFDLSNMDESIQLDDKLGPPQVDFIVCPTAPTPPPTLKAVSELRPVDTYMNDVFTVPASLAGLPAISIPFLIISEDKTASVPSFAGIQIIGQYSDDDRVLLVSRLLEKALTNYSLVRTYFTQTPRVRKCLSGPSLSLPAPAETRYNVYNSEREFLGSKLNNWKFKPRLRGSESKERTQELDYVLGAW